MTVVSLVRRAPLQRCLRRSYVCRRCCYDIRRAANSRPCFASLRLASLAQQADVERYVREHQAAIVREFMELLAIPNVRTDLPNIKRNAEQLRQMLERRGMKPEVWDTPSTPLVYGERLVPGSTRTVLFYIHYDGQPVDKAQWKQPDPFQPVLRAGTPRRRRGGNPRLRAGARRFPTTGGSTPARPATTRDRSRRSCRRWTPSAARRRTASR